MKGGDPSNLRRALGKNEEGDIDEAGELTDCLDGLGGLVWCPIIELFPKPSKHSKPSKPHP